tara:strand:+ start:158 stop:358 length:201 start_codon:yes stop_codon:yes gene_type:complete
MESALRVILDWSRTKSRELTDEPFDIVVDNPTDQAYEIKNYNNISQDTQACLDRAEFQELVTILVT